MIANGAMQHLLGDVAMNTERLIEAVRQNQTIFDKSKHSYRDKIAKENAWLKVSSVSGISGQ